jgi:hypothetical protein
MSYDLIFGHTGRSWCCGAHPTSSEPEGVVTQAQVDDLAEKVTGEVVKTTNLAIKLAQSKRLPDAEKEPFKKFHRRWVAFTEDRKGRYQVADSVALWNFRKLNERFKSRFDVFAKVATTPIRKPEGTAPAGTTALAPAIPAWSWGFPLCAGMMLAGLALAGRKSNPTKRTP